MTLEIEGYSNIYGISTIKVDNRKNVSWSKSSYLNSTLEGTKISTVSFDNRVESIKILS